MTACAYYCMVVVTKAIFSYDLRDVQYPFVLFCLTYPRTVGTRFHSATRRELLHHGRRAGDEEMNEIREVSGETNLMLHIETYQL